MTAAALSHSSPLPWGVPTARRGPSLHLVPPRTERPATVSTDAVSADAVGTVTLTRRGRLAVTMTMLAILAATPLTVMSVVAPADAGTQVVVLSGQSLSQIAATQLPQERLDLAIVRIQRANALSSNEVQAGQVLQIPAP